MGSALEKKRLDGRVQRRKTEGKAISNDQKERLKSTKGVIRVSQRRFSTSRFCSLLEGPIRLNTRLFRVENRPQIC